MNATKKKSLRDEIMDALGEGRCSRRRILLVEDDPEIREALRVFLETRYEVVGVESGRGILEMLDSYEPVLVILDVNLPGKDGFQLCRALRSSPRHRHLPVMFLTARRDDESFVKSIEADADAYLNKPFEGRELQATIDRLIGRR